MISSLETNKNRWTSSKTRSKNSELPLYLSWLARGERSAIKTVNISSKKGDCTMSYYYRSIGSLTAHNYKNMKNLTWQNSVIYFRNTLTGYERGDDVFGPCNRRPIEPPFAISPCWGSENEQCITWRLQTRIGLRQTRSLPWSRGNFRQSVLFWWLCSVYTRTDPLNPHISAQRKCHPVTKWKNKTKIGKQVQSVSINDRKTKTIWLP